MMSKNLDVKTVTDFGAEWTRFDQTGMSQTETLEQFERYFSVFPWDSLPPEATPRLRKRAVGENSRFKGRQALLR
jgi:hypothetical protein